MQMKRVVLVTVALVVLFSFNVRAQQTLKTVEVPIGFVAQSTADTDYITTLNINPPDGIASIVSFELLLRGDFQSSTGIKAKVRKTGTSTMFDCTPATWTTPAIDAPNYELSFDCSDLANYFDFTTGRIDAGFRTNKVAQNLKGHVRITYYNNPKGDVAVMGTEYRAGENGTMFLQLLDSNKNAVNDGFCELTAYYPDKSKYMDRTPMTFLENGLYYKDFIAPSSVGVYMINAYCYYSDVRYTFDTPDNVSCAAPIEGNEQSVQDTDCSFYKSEVAYTDHEPINATHLKAGDVQQDNDSMFTELVNITAELTDDNDTTTYQTIHETIVALSYDGFECGGFNCGTGWLNDWQYTGGTDITATNDPIGTYHMRLENGEIAYRNVSTSGITTCNASFYIKAQSLEAGDYCRYYWYNGTSLTLIDELTDGEDELAYVQVNQEVCNTYGTAADSGIYIAADSGNGDYCYIDQIYVNQTYGYAISAKFNATYDANKYWYLKIKTTSSSSDNLKIYAYNNTDQIATATSITEAISGSGWHYINVSSLLDYETNTIGLSYTKLRVFTQETGYISEAYLRQFDKEVAQNYTFDDPEIGNINLSEVTQLDVVWAGINTYIGALYIWNYTSNDWYKIGTDVSASISSDKECENTHYVTRTVYNGNISQLVSGDEVKIKFVMDNPTVESIEQVWIDDVSLIFHNNGSMISDIRGSGELHIHGWIEDMFDLLNETNNKSAIAEYVWNYTNRSLSEFNFTDLDINDTAILNAINGLVNLTAEQVWTYSNRNLTYTDYETIAEYVWNASSRNLTYYQDVTDYLYMQALVWNATSRTLTLYPDNTSYLYIQDLVWNATDRNLTYYQDVTQYLYIQALVWNYTNRTLTDYNQSDLLNAIYGLNNLTAEDVWSYHNRTLTEFNFTVNINETNLLNAINNLNNLTAEQVWNYATRNLTYYPAVDYDYIQELVWNRTDRNLTYYEDTTQYLYIQSLVWNATSRTLTLYPDQTDYIYIQDMVWNATNRNLTYYQDVTNYLYIQSLVWNATNRTLTDYNQSDILTAILNLENITVADVWSYYNRSLSEFNFTDIDVNDTDIINAINGLTNLTAEEVWNYASRNLTYEVEVDYDTIADYVWNNTDRNLTYYQDVTQYLYMQSLVWNATDRNLTYYPVSDYSLIGEYVWNNTDRNLTYYQDVTQYLYIQSLIWNATNRSLTDYNQSDILNAIYNLQNLTASDVWSYYNRSLSDFNFTVNLTDPLTAEEIWTYASRNLTYYPDVDYDYIQTLVWNNTDRNLTYYQDVTDYLYVQSLVWNATNRSLTLYVDNTDYLYIQDLVWNASQRNLTYYQDVVNYLYIQSLVWNNTYRNLTDYNHTQILNDIYTNYLAIQNLNNLSSSDVWSYFNRTLSDFNFTAEINDSAVLEAINNLNDITAEDVWNYIDRNLTYTDIDYDDISNYVWNNTDRNLTYYQDVTNYLYLQALVWNATSRTLTFYPANDTINYNTIQDYVWNATDRNLTYYQDVTQYLYIQGLVWNATNRTLTDFNFTGIDINDTNITDYLDTINSTTQDTNENVNSIISNLQDIPIVSSIDISGQKESQSTNVNITIYATVIDGFGERYDPDYVNLTIFNPLWNKTIINATMTKNETGLYYYSFALNSSDAFGTYLALVAASKSNSETISGITFVLSSDGAVTPSDGVTGDYSYHQGVPETGGTYSFGSLRTYRVYPTSIETSAEDQTIEIEVENLGIYTLEFDIEISGDLIDILTVSPYEFSVIPGEKQIIELRFTPNNKDYEGFINVRSKDFTLRDSPTRIDITLNEVPEVAYDRITSLFITLSSGEITRVPAEVALSLTDGIYTFPSGLCLPKWIVPVILSLVLIIINWRRKDEEKMKVTFMLLGLALVWIISAFFIPSIPCVF